MLHPTIEDITVEQLQRLMADVDVNDYLLIDVREPEEYAASHIPGARLLPLMNWMAGQPKVSSNEHAIFYCRSGNRSLRAAQLVAARESGFRKIYNLRGGINAWQGNALSAVPNLELFGDTDNLAQLLRRAMDLEKGADRFYAALAKNLAGSPVADLVRKLEEGEQAHARGIYRMLEKALGDEGRPVPSFEDLYEELPGIALESGEPLTTVLSSTNGEEPGREAILEFALELELRSFDLYRNLAETVDDEGMRAAFSELAKQEQHHAETVTRAIGRLAANGSLHVEPFFDHRTSTLTYVVHDTNSREAVVIDPVLDYEPAASKVFTESVDEVIRYLREQELELRFILETHAHADHLSGSQRLKDAYPKARVAVSDDIVAVQETFKGVFDLPDSFPTDGSQFDRLLAEGDRLQFGELEVEVIKTPGHTPACVTFKIGDAIFTGDALFMPDGGTGRCDFPGGSAEAIYQSIQKLYRLPDETQVFVGHDYQPNGRELAFRSTIGEEKQDNVALPQGRGREDFVRWRRARDESLAAPKLLFQSVQVNVDAGRLPDPKDNQRRYLKIPVNAFKAEVTSSVAEEAVVRGKADLPAQV